MSASDPKKKKAVVALCVFGILALALAGMAIKELSDHRKEGTGGGSVIMNIPDAEGAALVDTKTEAYAQSTYLDDNIGKELEDAEDLWASLNSKADENAGKPDFSNMDLFEAVVSVGEDGRLRDERKKEEAVSASAQKAVAAPVAKPRPKEQAVQPSRATAAAVKPKPKAQAEPSKKEEPVRIVDTDDGFSSTDGSWDDWEESTVVGSATWVDDEDVDVTESTPVRCAFTQVETIKSGQRVMVRCLDPIMAAGIVIPRNSRLAAVATVGAGRLYLTVSGYQVNGKFYTMNLVAYDSDGSKGLYCPDTERYAKDAATQAVQAGSSVLNSAMGSTKARALSTVITAAVGAGTQMAQQELSKVKVTVPSGYSFFLRSEPM